MGSLHEDGLLAALAAFGRCRPRTVAEVMRGGGGWPAEGSVTPRGRLAMEWGREHREQRVWRAIEWMLARGLLIQVP